MNKRKKATGHKPPHYLSVSLGKPDAFLGYGSLLWPPPALPPEQSLPSAAAKYRRFQGIPGLGELPLPRELPSGRESVLRQCPPGNTAPGPFLF